MLYISKLQGDTAYVTDTTDNTEEQVSLSTLQKLNGILGVSENGVRVFTNEDCIAQDIATLKRVWLPENDITICDEVFYGCSNSLTINYNKNSKS